MDQLYLASIWKRLLADVIDLLMFAVVLLAITLPLYFGAWDLFGISKTDEEEMRDRVDSGLFDIQSEDKYDFLSFDLEADDKPQEFQKFQDAVVYYYQEYKPTLPEDEFSEEARAEELSNSWLNTTIFKINSDTLKSDLLIIDSLDQSPSEARLVESITVDDITYTQEDDEYWQLAVSYLNNDNNTGVYDLAITDYAGLPHILKYRDRRDSIHWFEAMVGVSISAVIFFLIIPSIFPHCQTLGKKFERIGAISREGYNASLAQRLIRNFIQTAFIFVSGVLAIFIPLALDLILLACNKQHRSLADYIAGTTLVDLSKSTLIDVKDAPIQEDKSDWAKYEKGN